MKRLVLFLLLAVLGSISFSPAYAQRGTGWSAPVDLTDGTGVEKAGYSVLLCDPQQNMHMVWIGVIEDQAYLFYQNDLDGSLSTPIDVVAFGKPFAFWPTATISPRDDTLHVLWTENLVASKLYYTDVPLALAADPKAWSEPILLHPSVSAQGGSVAVDPSGALHVVYGVAEGGGRETRVEHVQSTDGGQTWSPPTTLFSHSAPMPSEIAPKLTIDGKGRLWVAITLRSFEYGQYSEMGYATSQDGGLTWSPYQQVAEASSPPGVAYLGFFTFGDDEIHMTWHDPKRMHQYSTDGGQTWSKPQQIIPLGAAFGNLNQIVRDSSDKLHAITGVSDGLYSIGFQNGGWLPSEQIDNRYLDPHNWNMVVCGGNRLSAAYTDRLGPEHIWYFTRQLPAPAIARQPIPASAPVVVASTTTEATPVSGQDVAAIPTDSPVSQTTATGVPPPNTSSMLILAVAILPVLALIAGVFVLKLRGN